MVVQANFEPALLHCQRGAVCHSRLPHLRGPMTVSCKVHGARKHSFLLPLSTIPGCPCQTLAPRNAQRADGDIARNRHSHAVMLGITGAYPGNALLYVSTWVAVAQHVRGRSFEASAGGMCLNEPCEPCTIDPYTIPHAISTYRLLVPSLDLVPRRATQISVSPKQHRLELSSSSSMSLMTMTVLSINGTAARSMEDVRQGHKNDETMRKFVMLN
jgi:hypothetical protein